MSSHALTVRVIRGVATGCYVVLRMSFDLAEAITSSFPESCPQYPALILESMHVFSICKC